MGGEPGRTADRIKVRVTASASKADRAARQRLSVPPVAKGTRYPPGQICRDEIQELSLMFTYRVQGFFQRICTGPKKGDRARRDALAFMAYACASRFGKTRNSTGLNTVIP